jgi:hypothetical protein
MGTATPVSLHVRPHKVAHLCFEVDGILEISAAQLGSTVAAFDFPAFYAILGSMPTVAGDASRLRYDFPVIDAAVAPFALAALRKEPRKAALNTAINARQNAYFAKYANAPAIVALMNSYYSPSVAESKPNRLAVLSGSANDQQFERAQVSLMDQQFARFMYGQNLPNLGAVFANELTNIDASVYRLQVAYLNTILMSPIAGTITGIYKNPGEAVRAAEPVVRIEDNSTVYLLATVIYRGPVAIGSTISVSTSLFDQSPSVPATLTGSVVSVHGHHDEDKWDIVAACGNLDASAEPIFPVGYHFDYDDTTVAIS